MATVAAAVAVGTLLGQGRWTFVASFAVICALAALALWIAVSGVPSPAASGARPGPGPGPNPPSTSPTPSPTPAQPGTVAEPERPDRTDGPADRADRHKT